MPHYNEENNYDKKKQYDYCGYVAPRINPCFDEKISKSKWNCDKKDNKYNKNKHDEKKEYKPYDRCKCRDFKVVYYLPKFYVEELKNDTYNNDIKKNTYKKNYDYVYNEKHGDYENNNKKTT